MMLVFFFIFLSVQVRDLLKTSDTRGAGTVLLGEPSHGVELVEESIESSAEFARVFKLGSQMRANMDEGKSDRKSRSHLYALCSHSLQLVV